MPANVPSTPEAPATSLRASHRAAARACEYDGLVTKGITTSADPGATGWSIRDPVVQLRIRGGDQSTPLAGPGPLLVGTSDECAVRLDDGLAVSRQHASLEQRDGAWALTDLGSTNGTRQDGEDRESFVLAPAMEVEFGRSTVVAESTRSIALRELLRRAMGWHPSKLVDVDSALQSVRQLGNLRAALLILGDGSMSGIARRIHHLILGDDRPFSAHSPKESGQAAVERARDGVVVFDVDTLPSDVAAALVTCRLPSWRVRLVLAARTAKSAVAVTSKLPSVMSMTLPPLAEREVEIDRLLLAYAADAATTLSAPATGLRPQDLGWVRAGGLKNLDEIDEVMTRLTAVRNWGVTGGAARLGLTHGALSKYFRRRKIPT